MAQLAVDTVGRKHLRQERIGFVKSVRFYPGTIPPGSKWQGEQKYAPDKWPAPDVDSGSERTRILIQRLAITDAAGRRCEVRPYRAGPPPGPVAARVADEFRAAQGAQAKLLSRPRVAR